MNNVFCLTLSLRCFYCSWNLCTVIALMTSLALKAAGEEKPNHLPSRKLTAAEQQQYQSLLRNPRLVTKFNGKDNPGDRDTWYVLGFMDAAALETKTRETSMTAQRLYMWSSHTNQQKKIAKDAIVVQGRAGAALAVMDHLNAPNQAVAKIRPPSGTPREGWIKRQASQGIADRIWNAAPFESEVQARQFYESVRPKN